MANFGWLNQWSDAGAKKGHSPFDLSKKMVFGLPNSLLVPIKFIETVPDDHLQIDLQGLVRTETLNTAAFYQGKVEFEVFFVPYKQLWHNFNQFVVKKEDKHSTLYKNSAFAPNVNLCELIKFVLSCYDNQVTDEFGYPVAFHMAKLLQHCKICNIWPLFTLSTPDASLFASKFKDKYVNIWRILAYQHIFYDRYRNKYYDDMPLYQPSDADDAPINYIDTFNVDNIDCGSFATSHLPDWSNLEHQTVEYNPDEFLFDYAPQAFYANLLSLHYAPYRKDLYTSLLPSSQFGAVAGVDIANDIKITIGTNGVFNTSDDDGRWTDENGNDMPQGVVAPNEDHLMVHDSGQDTSIKHIHEISISNKDGSIMIPSAFDVLSMRRAELLQSWKQNALRAGNMVDANFRSHYGVEPYYEDDNNVKFLGSYVANIDLNPVTATAATGGDNGKVGDLAAFGVGKVQGSMIDFNCKDFGTIVVVAHVASEVYYSANGCDKQNTLVEPFDYFQSEFQDAGLDTVPLSQQSLFVTDEVDTSLGYTPPYTCYKTDVDETFDQYASAYINVDTATIEEGWFGNMNAWTVRRSDYNVIVTPDGTYVTEGLPISRFYQSPGLTDTLFGVKYDGQSCPFGVALSVNTKAIRPMSILGIPIFS